jgi:hypothetical protein
LVLQAFWNRILPKDGQETVQQEFESKNRLHWIVGEMSRRTLVLGLAFLLAIAGSFLFATRARRHARQFHDADEPIHAWMSVPFIAHTHHVPASVLFQAIGVQPRQPHDRRSVRRIAHDLNRPVPELIAQLQRAIDAAAQPPGGPPR